MAAAFAAATCSGSVDIGSPSAFCQTTGGACGAGGGRNGLQNEQVLHRWSPQCWPWHHEPHWPSPPLPSAQCGHAPHRLSLQWCSCLHQFSHMASWCVQKRQPLQRASFCEQYHSVQPALHGPAGGEAGAGGPVWVECEWAFASNGKSHFGGAGGDGGGETQKSQSAHISLTQLADFSHLHHEAHLGGDQSARKPPPSSSDGCSFHDGASSPASATRPWSSSSEEGSASPVYSDARAPSRRRSAIVLRIFLRSPSGAAGARTRLLGHTFDPEGKCSPL